MGDIKAGVTLMQDFCRPKSEIFSGYIDYLDREEAQRNHAIQTFNLFNDYMGNPEKSTGLFTNEKDNLTHSEKRELKDVFQTAQDNESVMWQTVISFDNRWLEQNGIYDSQKQILDEQKLKEVTRLAVNRLLKSEGLEHAVWSAGIHYNTDNLHVHIATVEPYPMREKMMYNGKKEVRGKFKLQNINNCKSAVVNEIMRTKDINLQINNIIRKDIIASAESRNFREDPVIREQFLKLFENLQGVPKHKQNYNSYAIKPFREQIDGISEAYIQKYCKEEYKKFTEILQRQSKLYAEAYGGGNWEDFEQTKKEDLYRRMGNFVLREMRAYEVGISKKETSFELEKTYLGSGYREEKVKITENLKEDLLQQEESNIETLEVQRTEQMFEKAGDLFEKSSQQNKSSESYMDYFKEWKDLQEQIDFAKEKNLADMLEKKYQDNPFVMYFIGEITMYGRGTEIDLEKSQECFQKSLQMFEQAEPYIKGSETNSFDLKSYVQYRIGKQYNRGWGTEKDVQEAIQWFENSDTDYARYALGNIYYRGDDVEQDYEKAFQIFQGISNSAFAEQKKAVMYECGQGTEINLGAAENSYKNAFDGFLSMDRKLEGDPLSQYQIGKMLYTGKGCEQNTEKAISYLEKSAEGKNVPAQLLLSQIYIKYDIREKLPVALGYLTELAEKGDNEIAQYALGKLFISDEKLKDINKGVGYLKAAEEKGNTYAKILLGKVYLDLDSGIYDVEQGVRYLTELVEAGDEYACYYLGKEYVRKESPYYNEAKGVQYLERAKEQGNDRAKYFVGKIYLDKISSEYSPELGLQYMTELAESGNEYAQLKLGFEYLKGENVERNIFSSYNYFSQAAAQGNQLAENMMLDLSTERTKRRMGSPLGELDKALMQLNKSFRTEMIQSMKNIREYNLEQEYVLDEISL
ncbi:MAG: MobP2 family relaxase [Faecalimonas sp.]|nr:MobP2 family relaxase [Faecalimonas sp.]